MAESSNSPLAGKRVVITRAALESSELLEMLSRSGAIPVLLPLISFAAPESYAPLDAALLEWSRFDWVMFTSAYAVQAVMGRATRQGRILTKNALTPRIGVVGPVTKDKAEKAGFSVHHMARTHLGVALAEELGDSLRGKRVLLPRSDRASPDLPSALRKLGAHATEVTAYRTVRPSDADQEKLAGVARGEADAILFFSPSAVHSFVELSGRKQLSILQDRVAMAAIGPVTASALRELGVHRIVLASEPNAAAVVHALESRFAKHP